MRVGDCDRQRIGSIRPCDLHAGQQALHHRIDLRFFRSTGANDRFLDQMLTMALIEARSCERFKRLSEGLHDTYLQKFYRRFMESEAGHYTLFIDLAETYIDKEKVRRRWKEWLEYEADIISNLEIRGDRIH